MAVERPPQGAGVEVQDHDRAMADVGEIDVSSVEELENFLDFLLVSG
jgi:hypothetical protein